MVCGRICGASVQRENLVNEWSMLSLQFTMMTMNSIFIAVWSVKNAAHGGAG